MKKLLLPLAFLLIISFLVAGCGATSSAPASKVATVPAATSPTTLTTNPGTTTPAVTKPASSVVTPQSGGILKSYLQGDPYGLGYPPSMTGQADGSNSSVCLETLFYFDQQDNLTPLLATGYSTDPVAKTITINLRQGVKFQDGTDFNATACKWNLDQYRAGGRPELKKVTSVDIVDNNTIRLDLSTFDSTIIESLSTGSDAGRMISPAAFQANGGKDWAVKNPWEPGPFQFVNWNRTVNIVWKRFDGYWGGKPYLDGIEMKEYADPTVALLDFKSGNLHTFGVTPQDAKTMKADGKFNIVMPPDGNVPALAGYALDPSSPFAKLAVRQAMSYAIDVNSLATTFGLGFYTVQNQWALPGTWGYNTSVVGYPYNPQKAKDLLAQAGYPTGFKTTLNFYNFSSAQVDESTAIQAQLKAVGIDATLNPLLRPAFVDIASNGKGWSGIIREQGLSSPDPLIKFAGTAGSIEFAGVYLSPEFKDIYNQATAAPDFTTKQKLVWQLMSTATDKDCIATYLYVQGTPIAKSKNLHDDLYGVVSFYYIGTKAWLSK